MLFNSFEFLIFFIPVYVLYVILKHKWQNRLLIVASCLFYAVWSWQFLFLMFASISTDFWCSHSIERSNDPRKRRFFLGISICTNLAILGFFKYYNFFAANAGHLLQAFGHPLSLTLNIILPLGISFYTFEAISYVVDVYRRQVKPAKSYWDYVLFVIYFPHLIAGPIMRAKDFIPQVMSPRPWRADQFYEGCYLFFWGLFEKVFVADNLAKIVNPVFVPASSYNGAEVLVALYAFAFQIFCDFDGYSNMARGLGKCMGFEISINFKLPYFATNPREFWQRWHITLSSWLRDYVYIPLGGNRKGELRLYGSLVLTMLLGGFWHGASWTFVMWGAYHGVLLIAFRFLIIRQWFEKTRVHVPWVIKAVFMFHLVVLGWLFFRAASFHQIIQMTQALFFNFSLATGKGTFLFFKFLDIVFPLLVIQVGQYLTQDLLFLYHRHWALKAVIYAFLAYLMLAWGVMRPQEFFYFQF